MYKATKNLKQIYSFDKREDVEHIRDMFDLQPLEEHVFLINNNEEGISVTYNGI